MAKLAINPFTTVRYHKGWMQDKIKYKVLTCDQMAKTDQELVRATVKTMVNGVDVSCLVHQWATEAANKERQPDWQYIVVDAQAKGLGRIGILKYHGIEVALFIKRMVTELCPDPGSPIPEHQLKDPDDAWQRLDLMGQSAKRSNLVLTRYHEQLESDNRFLKKQIQSLQQRFDAVESRLGQYLSKEEEAKDREEERLRLEKEKLKPKAAKPSQDRLCVLCQCYENVHRFNKKGKCLGCDGGKVACTKCPFKPKKTRKRRKV